MIGAELKSLKGVEYEYLWHGDPAYWHRSAPILFPAIGRFKDDRTFFNNKAYQIPKHGFLKNMRFTVVSHDETNLILGFDANDETKNMYPFQFEFRVHYVLDHSTLTTTLTVKNTGDEPMPFHIGGHPAFKIPIEPNERFEDYAIHFPKIEHFNSPKVVLENGTIDWTKTARSFKSLRVLPLCYEDFKDDALIFDNIKSDYVILQNKRGTQGVKFSFEGFKTLAIWTPSHIHSPFLCLEPWIGCADSPDSTGVFLDKKDVIVLPSHQQLTKSYSITVLHQG